MQFTIYTDGGSLNNPGEAAIAFLIYKDSVLLEKKAERIGTASNNIAEYTALYSALKRIKEISGSINKSDVQRITTISDSLLMVSQLNGLFKVKDASIHEILMKIRMLEAEIAVPISYKHVRREENKLADALVKKVLLRP